MGFWSKLFGGAKAEQASERERLRQPERADPRESRKKAAESAFVAWCLVEIRQHPAVERAEAGEGASLPVAIWTRSGDEQKLYLKNTFLETRESSPEGKLAALRRLLTGLDDVGGALEWEEARTSLVPLLRAATFAATVMNEARSMVARPFVPFLSVFLGTDQDTCIAFTTQKELDAWGQSADLALAHAIENMQRHVDAASEERPEARLYDKDAPSPIWHLVRDDSYESSRLLLPGYLASFRGKVAGNPIAIVPHRSLLVISGDADPQALARLAKMAEDEFNASPRSVSPVVYSVDANGQVVPLRLPAEHPQHPLVERGQYLLAQDVYGVQKAVLEQRFEKEGVDVFVASYLLFRSAGTGALYSAGTMTRGVRTLLPETDKITLVSDGEKTFFVPRAALLELAPECFEEAPEFYPPRLRVVAWPEASKLAELRLLAAR